MDRWTLRQVVLAALIVLMVGCGGGGGSGDNDTPPGGSSSSSGGGSSSSSGGGSSSSSGSSSGGLSGYNPYLPVSNDITLFYNSSDIPSRFDGLVEHNGNSAHVLSYMNGNRHYLDSTPDDIYLQGYFAAARTIGQLGEFAVDVRLDSSLPLWNRDLRAGNSITMNTSGTASIAPAYGDKTLEFTLTREYLGLESVSTPYGQIDGRVIFVAITASVELEGMDHELHWESTFWLVKDLGIARLDDNGELLLLTGLDGPDGDGDGIPDLFDGFPDDPNFTFDTDSDGIPNETDPDSDGDGVADIHDAFPLDALEQKDTDSDGTGNSVDTDDDGDGVPDPEDAFAEDAMCWLPQHGDSEEKCERNPRAPGFAPDKIFADANGVLYLFSEDLQAIHRWSAEEERYLNPIYGAGEPSARMVAVAYLESQDRLYLGYDNGNINFIAPSESMLEQGFTTLPQSVGGLVDVGNYLLVQESTNYRTAHFIYDREGSRVASRDWNYYSSVHAWNPHNSRLYHFREGVSPNDLQYQEIDQASGQIVSQGDSPYRGDYNIFPPIRVSPDGTLVAVGSGGLYDANSLTWQGSVGAFKDGLWLEEGALLLAIQSGDKFRLERRAAQSAEKVEVLEFPGSLLAVRQVGSRILLVSRNGHDLAVTEYVPDDDGDGDGIPNLEDAFPLDPAASADSDNDGYPDSWNDGYGEEDSSTGLTLDAFPDDSACWLAEHDDGNGQCDYAATMPRFTPERIVAGENGTVYLFSPENRRVYRWSAETESYLNPILVGEDNGFTVKSPTLMDHSGEHRRLYFGYDSGEITFVSLDGSPVEESFAHTPMPVSGLAAVGNYLLAQDDSGAWESHHIFDMHGALTDSADWNHYSREYAWSPVNSRVYFFRDTTSPNDLHYEEIDQVGGQIVSEGETPYHGAYDMAPPIRVARDGGMVALGAGDIYAADSLVWLGSVGEFVDALWLESGELLTIAQGDDSHRLERRSANLVQVVEADHYPGAIRAVRQAGAHIVLVSELDGDLSFRKYTPSDDSDGDGVTNLEDAFPLDPAASVDSDNDGYPDFWNDGYSGEDSTAGLALDAFPGDSACWLTEHDDGSGQCDYAATMPQFTPDKIIADDSGILYLFSSEHHTVYRWSAETSAYLNPIYVGKHYGLTVKSPSQMAYSESHGRLYFAYDSGEITYIDLTGNLVETSFTRLSMAVAGLAAVGNYVLAADASGAWNTHYIFDAQGALTDTAEWRYIVHDSAWDPINSRLYYFRYASNPYDLYYEEIDQNSGEIGDRGQGSFYGQAGLRQPIRISTDGSLVISGAGSFLDADDLQWRGRITGFTDALWLDGGELVTVAQSPESEASSGFRLRRLGSDLLTPLEEWESPGTALRLVRAGTTNIIVSQRGGDLEFVEYVPNDDRDGDGISNLEDAFPLDPAASGDSDNDGYPDEWNSGYDQADSTTGLLLDAFPSDAACWLADGHGDGSGGCDFSASIPDFTPSVVVADQDGILYLFAPEYGSVYRWSADTREFLNPIRVGGHYGMNEVQPSHMAYSESHQRLYFAYDSGRLTFVDLESGSLEESTFGTTWNAVEALAAAGNYLMVQSLANYEVVYIYDSAGNIVDTGSGAKRYDNSYAWDSESSRIYQLNHYASNLAYTEIDQGSGEIRSGGYVPGYSESPLAPPIRVSADGGLIVLGSGVIYDGRTLAVLGSVGEFDDAIWLDTGELLRVERGQNGFRLMRREAGLSREVETVDFPGEFVAIRQAGPDIVIVSKQGGALLFTDYLPSDDSDGDGVANNEDAFPLDPAASLDGDRDGYPDAWNPGYSEEDSASGLVLDAFPEDAACWLSEHDDGTGLCDYAAVVPEFVPDEIAADANGTVYLLSSQHRTVFRWSAREQSYLQPIFVGEDNGVAVKSPIKMVYSAAHERLYFSYETGEITYVDLNGSLDEQDFASLSQAVRSLAAIGNYVLVQEGVGSYPALHIFSANGALRDSNDWVDRAVEVAWNDVNSRFYFLRSISSSYVYYGEIDRSTGELTASGNSPYYSRMVNQLPLRVVNSGKHLLLGSGRIYQADTLELADFELPGPITDAVDFGELLAASSYSGGRWFIDLYGYGAYEPLMSFQLDSKVLRIFPLEESILVVGQIDETLTYSIIFLGDSDEDGMPAWWELLHGLSDEDAADAVQDLDSDTLTNLQEYVAGTNPLESDTDGDGLSDYDEIQVYQTLPDLADSDGDGLSDGDEVLVYFTDPNLLDSDGDSFSDRDERFKYNTDPNDPESIPQAITALYESFEGETVPLTWEAAAANSANWYLVQNQSSDGNRSIRSGAIDDGEGSAIVFDALFSAGTLRFDARVDSESCCDWLQVLVDGERRLDITSGDWAQYALELDAGEHEIEWRYRKDGSVSTGEDAVWIDNVNFGP